jgi:hypothetical protein
MGIYINRTVGGDRHYRAVDVDLDAGIESGKTTSQDNRLSESQTMDHVLFDVYRRQ